MREKKNLEPDSEVWGPKPGVRFGPKSQVCEAPVDDNRNNPECLTNEPLQGGLKILKWPCGRCRRLVPCDFPCLEEEDEQEQKEEGRGRGGRARAEGRGGGEGGGGGGEGGGAEGERGEGGRGKSVAKVSKMNDFRSQKGSKTTPKSVAKVSKKRCQKRESNRLKKGE